MKRRIVAAVSLIVVVGVFIVLGERLQLYKDYVRSVERTLDVRELALNHEEQVFEGELVDGSHVFDDHVYFSLDAPYYLSYDSEDVVEYRYGEEVKAITIHKMGVPVDARFAEMIARNTVLDEETILGVLEPYEFGNDLDAYLYAVKRFSDEKLSVFSSRADLQREIVLNGAVEQFSMSFFLGDQEDTRLMLISGNVDGMEIIDNMFQLTNGQYAYNVTFVGDYTEAEVEQFMRTLHIY